MKTGFITIDRFAPTLARTNERLMFAQLDTDPQYRPPHRPPVQRGIPEVLGDGGRMDPWDYGGQGVYPWKPPPACVRCGMPRPRSNGYCSEICERAQWRQDRIDYAEQTRLYRIKLAKERAARMEERAAEAARKQAKRAAYEAKREADWIAGAADREKTRLWKESERARIDQYWIDLEARQEAARIKKEARQGPIMLGDQPLPP